jgi:hypothetical protein
VLTLIEEKLERRSLLALSLIVAFYALKRLPEALSVESYHRLIYPAFSIYASKSILFPDGALNRSLDGAVISPANAVFIYPPGTYAITFLFDRLSSLFLFCFVVQAFVPILVFYLLRPVVSTVTAALLALVAVQYWTVIQPHPDYTIQPLMLLAILLLHAPAARVRLGPWRLALVGGLTGLVMVLKHNIGVFFLLLCATSVLFEAIEIRPHRRVDTWLLSGVLAASLAFGLVFASRAAHLDALVFYLLPYLAFWGMVGVHLLSSPTAGIDWRRLVRSWTILVACSLALPAYVFWTFGGLVGYRRYWYSLFEMGFRTLGVWDLGLMRIVRDYLRQAWVEAGAGFMTVVDRSLVAVFFLAPFAVAIGVCYCLWRRLSDSPARAAVLRESAPIASMAVMAPFMLFPLEDYRILRTKVVVSVFAALWLGRHALARSVPLRTVVVAVLGLVVGVAGLGVREGWRWSRAERAAVSGDLRTVIDLPLAVPVAAELDKQEAVIRRSVPASEFLLVHFGGMEMAPLLVLRRATTPQYYIETREEFLDRETTVAIIHSLQHHPYLIVRAPDLRRFLDGRPPGTHSREILDSVHRHFDIVDRYERPAAASAMFSGIADFYVMKRKAGGA